MKLWFAVPFGAIMFARPLVAEWFVLCCICLAVIFGPIAAYKSIRASRRGL